jgi:inosine triphosphate pyrophosphatase
MKQITLVTGNAGKLAEWRRLWPFDTELVSEDVDLDEIQSMDLEAIVTDKVRRAYAAIGKPVIVEDVSAGLDKLGELPGPFIKFFEKSMGLDALFQIAHEDNASATVRCAVAYYDGETLLTAHSELHGIAVASRGMYGFGFDKNFQPTGSTKTFGEMAPTEKDTVSHRAKAVGLLADKLASL